MRDSRKRFPPRPTALSWIVMMVGLSSCGYYGEPVPYQAIRCVGAVDSLVLPLGNSNDPSDVIVTLPRTKSVSFNGEYGQAAGSKGIVPVLATVADQMIYIRLDSALGNRNLSFLLRIEEIHPYLSDFRHGRFKAAYLVNSGSWKSADGEIWTNIAMNDTLTMEQDLRYTLEISNASGLFLRMRETLLVLD